MCRVMMSIAILCALTDASVAQQPSPTPAFEAASVKSRTTANPGWSISYTPDSLRATNATLSALIQSAYGIREDRLVGGPQWVRATRFDVNGKAAQALSREQLRLMAQRLLEDRFGVVLTRSSANRKSTRRASHEATDAWIRTCAARPTLPWWGRRWSADKPTRAADTEIIDRRRSDVLRNVHDDDERGEGVVTLLGVEIVDQTGLQGRWICARLHCARAQCVSRRRAGADQSTHGVRSGGGAAWTQTRAQPTRFR